jgi:heme/copper-type cytochrome/quinol oxidase subunit 2
MHSKTNTFRRLLMFAVTLFLASAVQAADAAEQQQSTAAAWFWGLFWMLLPIALMVPVLIVTVNRLQKPTLHRNREHMERQVQHMERVEKSLSHIVKLLETKD